MTARHAIALTLALGVAAPAGAQTAATPFVVVNEDVGVPVFPNDLLDRPYEVIGEVTAHVRKATVFSKDADQAKIYRVLWKKAVKMGADAVVKASYGDSHVTLVSWGSTTATGMAVKFVTTPPVPTPAPSSTGR